MLRRDPAGRRGRSRRRIETRGYDNQTAGGKQWKTSRRGERQEEGRAASGEQGRRRPSSRTALSAGCPRMVAPMGLRGVRAEDDAGCNVCGAVGQGWRPTEIGSRDASKTSTFQDYLGSPDSTP